MSFAMTTPQILDRSKTVTRRLGWGVLKPGMLVQAIEKGQGLKAGEKVRKLAVIRVTDARWEQLNEILPDDVAREGFPELTTDEFITMFCHANRCWPHNLVRRIEFEYVD